MQSAEDTDGKTIPVSRLAAFERNGGTTTEILALFDNLSPVSVEALRGRWRGSGLPSGHPMDGLLERFGWYGKEFNGPEDVQPLLCKTRGGEVFGLNPAFVPMGLVSRHVGLFHNRFAEAAFALSARAARATRPTARLRMTEFRGVVTATMIYACPSSGPSFSSGKSSLTACPKSGDHLRLHAHTDQRRATEVNVAVHALNRMLDLGRPISVRIA